MSEGYQHHQNNQQGIFSFPAPNGFVDRAADQQQAAGVLHPGIYESATAAGSLSEMFNFAGVTPLDLYPRSITPPPHQHHHQPPSTHMLLPSQGFHGHQTHLTWVAEGGGGGNGLSLSLSSSKAEAEERMMFFSNQEILGSSSTSFKNLGNQMHLQGYGHNQANFGFGLSSKYTRPAQELLEEFCSVGRVHLKKNKSAASTSGGGAGPSNSGKDPPPLSPPDRMEHQRRKVKLLAMLDEVERRYKHYWSEMQMVVNTYDVVMGVGASIPYTGLAQKAMSRHFRCLKEAIEAQLKHSCEVLGEKDVTGLTKGETPRLKVLEQSLRQQRGFHQMGMMEQEAWRPQRGLPERSVNILRAWLFEHFLNPYPSDADKHLLARQTGLSRNQVSNWFINARVRLWKPMVEEMYQKEAKEDEEDIEEGEREKENDAQTSTHDSATTPTTRTKTRAEERGIRSEINADDSDPTLFAINTVTSSFNPIADDAADACTGGGNMPGSTLIRFGAGDVSLTLGLRHSAAGGGKQPETSFSFRDFAS